MIKIPEIAKMENTIKFNFDKVYDFQLDYKTNYEFIRSLCIKNMLDDVHQFNKSMEKYENFVQIGIGGSALGASASIEFLGGTCGNYTNSKKYFVLDNIDPQRLDFIFSLDLDKTLFHVVSKSGSTMETISQFFIIYDKMTSIFKDKTSMHFVFTTSQSGPLYEFANKNGIKVFIIPNEVGGRYSVFTSVGLLPLSFLGYDIKDFTEGAKTAVRAYRNGWPLPNKFASFAMKEYKNGKNILVMFAYKDRLFSVADWFRQLWAESLGKDGLGQTPVKALGVTDQHSQLQLYQDGPKDKIVIFLDSPSAKDFIIKEPFEFSYLKNRSLKEIMEIEKLSTYKALEKSKVPCADIYISENNEYSLGAFYISLMIATAKAGEILNINPFDQPGVELGKSFARHALSQQNKE